MSDKNYVEQIGNLCSICGKDQRDGCEGWYSDHNGVICFDCLTDHLTPEEKQRWWEKRNEGMKDKDKERILYLEKVIRDAASYLRLDPKTRTCYNVAHDLEVALGIEYKEDESC